MAEDLDKPRYRRAENQFRLHARARRRQARPGERGLCQGRAPLRPDERPDVGRPAPAVEKRPRGLACAAEKRGSLRPSRRRRRHRRRGLAGARGLRPRRLGRDLRHQRGDDRGRPGERERRCREAQLRAGQCRGSALRRADVRRLYDRLRHAQSDAYAGRAPRGLPRAQARRAFHVPRILQRRGAAARHALRRLFLQGDPGAWRACRRRQRLLSLSGGEHPPLPRSEKLHAI